MCSPHEPRRATPDTHVSCGNQLVVLCFLGVIACAPTAPESCPSRTYEPQSRRVDSIEDCEVGFCPIECTDDGAVCEGDPGIYCEDCSRLFTFLDAEHFVCPSCRVSESPAGAISLDCR